MTFNWAKKPDEKNPGWDVAIHGHMADYANMPVPEGEKSACEPYDPLKDPVYKGTAPDPHGDDRG